LRLRFDASAAVQVLGPEHPSRQVEKGEFSETLSPGEIRVFSWNR
jgi:hypothetical protein